MVSTSMIISVVKKNCLDINVEERWNSDSLFSLFLLIIETNLMARKLKQSITIPRLLL